MKFSIDFSNNTKLFLTLKKNKIYWLLRHFEDSILAYTKDYIQKKHIHLCILAEQIFLNSPFD